MIKSNGAETVLLRIVLSASILSLLSATGCKRSKEIDVDSAPPGASVYIDDNLAGQTPTRVTIAASAQNLRVVSPGETFHQKAAKITSRTLKTAYTPLTANLPLFVAMERGYFAQNGIEVQAIEATSPNDILTGIVSGDLDFAAVLAYTILFPGANRYPGKFKLFSSCEETSKQFTSSIIAGIDSPIKSPGDLRGKKIGVYTGLVQINFLKAILVGMGIDPSEVQIVEISPRLQIQGLVSGEYDALSSTEPTTNIAILQGIAKVVVENPRVKYITRPFPSTAATIPTSLLQNEPEVATAIITSLNMAIDYINSHPDEAKRTLTKYTPIPKSIEAQVLADLKLFKYCKLGEENRLSVQRFADFMFENGIMKEKIDDVNKLFGDYE